MATWRKPDPALVEAFLAALPLTAGVERRQMFGCPCAFVHGNMFAGVHETRLIVRIPSEAAARPFAPMGRPMKDYAAIEEALDCEPRELREWVLRAFDYTRVLPPKVKKPAGKKSAAARKTAPVKKAAPVKKVTAGKKSAGGR
jgi:TfoX/Sxy family transcriptional regulator of competence genes